MVNGKLSRPRILDIPVGYWEAAVKTISRELDVAFMCIDKLEERVLELEDKLDER